VDGFRRIHRPAWAERICLDNQFPDTVDGYANNYESAENFSRSGKCMLQPIV
jgi:hypothetical protein